MTQLTRLAVDDQTISNDKDDGVQVVSGLFTTFYADVLDVEQFAQAHSSWCSLFESNAHSSGPNLLTLQGIY